MTKLKHRFDSSPGLPLISPPLPLQMIGSRSPQCYSHALTSAPSRGLYLTVQCLVPWTAHAALKQRRPGYSSRSACVEKLYLSCRPHGQHRGQVWTGNTTYLGRYSLCNFAVLRILRGDLGISGTGCALHCSSLRSSWGGLRR